MPSHEWPETSAGRLLAALARHYGPQPNPEPKAPFAMVLWEIVAYLTNDARRTKAFRALETRVGLTPKPILQAPESLLEDIAKMGGAIAYKDRAQRLIHAAQLGHPAPTVNALKRYPMIGEPGAEKILLFSNHLPVLALDSNGLRVLLRNGIGKQAANYAATYKSVRQAVQSDLPANCEILQQAHLLLRRHGQLICKNTNPACYLCPVQNTCPFRKCD